MTTHRGMTQRRPPSFISRIGDGARGQKRSNNFSRPAALRGEGEGCAAFAVAGVNCSNGNSEKDKEFDHGHTRRTTLMLRNVSQSGSTVLVNSVEKEGGEASIRGIACGAAVQRADNRLVTVCGGEEKGRSAELVCVIDCC